jgi:hypothetical protein
MDMSNKNIDIKICFDINTSRTDNFIKIHFVIYTSSINIDGKLNINRSQFEILIHLVTFSIIRL